MPVFTFPAWLSALRFPGVAAAEAALSADRSPATPRTAARPARRRPPLLAAVLAAGLAGGAALGCVGLDTWERSAIFQNRVDRAPNPWSRLPDGGHAFDLTVAGGERVHAWYVPSTGSDRPGDAQAHLRHAVRSPAPASPAVPPHARRVSLAPAADAGGAGPRGPQAMSAPTAAPWSDPSRAPTLLFLHGARHDLEGCAPRVAFWRSLGFNVLAIDYRGFGRSSERVPSEATAIEDAEAALAELRRREPDPSRRFVYGYSLGGAMAIALAARAQPGELGGVIVESSFTRIADIVAESRWGWVPLASLLVTQPFDSIRRIADVRTPLLFFHGTDDALIPHTMSDRLAAAAVQVPAPAKRVVKIAGATHRSGWLVGGEAVYGEAVRSFVAGGAQSGRPAAARDS